MGIGQSVPLAEFYAVSGGLRGATRIPNVNLRPISRRGAAMKRFTSLAIVFLSVGPLAAQPNFEVPKAVAIDAETLTKIEGKIEDLKVALDGLPRTLAAGIREDVEVYHKAAVWMVRHGEYFAKDTAKQTLAVLDAGLERAKHAAKGEAPWREVRGKPLVRGHNSPIDGSIQPVSVLVPADFDPTKPGFHIVVVLHGRDQTLTEVKFIAGKENAKAGTTANRIVVEVYGRGNNAFRWAGEQDVHEAINIARRTVKVAGAAAEKAIMTAPVFLRGFSMGGAGTWHIGLHHPSMFRAISPGAGFTTTHGYIKNLPKLPDYQERCLTIYDAVNYAENAFNVPVIAYSGEKDPQKAAADNIENALKWFKETLSFQHIVAPGLEHKQPPEWLAKIESEFAKIGAAPKLTTPERVRFVTYTLRYPECKWVRIEGLDRHYDRAVVDAVPKDGTVTVTTQNVSQIKLELKPEWKIVIDGQSVPVANSQSYEKVNGKWAVAKLDYRLRKRPGLQGPIDDVFHTPFRVVGPTKSGWIDDHAKASLARFGYEWDKYFRGTLPTKVHGEQSVLLFGDPASNPEIAAVLPKLPITWTAEKLVVNGVEYDPKTHVPVLIYPHPDLKGKYVVLNSGHTFRAADLKGTNALLYPRLGDWAVLKPNPTKADPAAADVVAAGIFDENWQFEK